MNTSLTLEDPFVFVEEMVQDDKKDDLFLEQMCLFEEDEPDYPSGQNIIKANQMRVCDTDFVGFNGDSRIQEKYNWTIKDMRRARPEFVAHKAGADGLPYLMNTKTQRKRKIKFPEGEGVHNKGRNLYPNLSYSYVKKDGGTKQTSALAHRFFAILFIENPDPSVYTEVNHKDGDKSNYRLDNLEWVDPSSHAKKDAQRRKEQQK
tara:strand:- start:2638 stop:3252 length:615 start_codon:yes stop_codon:yes gene_type:complete